MSNEIANRAAAGIILQLFPDPDPPIVLGSWGFDVSSIVRDTNQGVGFYRVTLAAPGWSRINETLTGLTELGQMVLTGPSAPDGGTVVAGLVAAPNAPAPTPGALISLPDLLISVLDAAGVSVDEDAVIGVEVRQFPQKD